MITPTENCTGARVVIVLAAASQTVGRSSYQGGAVIVPWLKHAYFEHVLGTAIPLPRRRDPKTCLPIGGEQGSQ